MDVSRNISGTDNGIHALDDQIFLALDEEGVTNTL
jgi:hypothetical protein